MTTEKEKLVTGQLYNAFDENLVSERNHASALYTELNQLGKSNREQRELILHQLFGACGKNLWVESPFFCDYGFQISVGDNVFVNFNCTILDGAPVKIGNNVLLGPNVQIYSATHPTQWKLRQKGLEYAKPVTIGNDVWIGGGAVICPGIKIGSRTTIGAGSVVTKDIPSDVVAAGNPARIIKHL